MQSKLAKGQTFSSPQEKLNKIWEILEKDMVCCFCDGSWMYNEICKVLEYGEYSPEEIKKNCDYFGEIACLMDCRKCEYSPLNIRK